MTDPATEREALHLFEALFEIAPGDRAGWIAASTEGRPVLRARLEALLAAQQAQSLRTGGAVAELAEEPAPERIGAYRITGLIGHGGMGTVYRGERAAGDFAHQVAIKLIKPGLLSAALVERFERERQILAGLVHPHIARLYDGGQTDAGVPYLVMELVDGQPLLDWAQASGADRAQRLAVFAQICAGVGFAHRNLVVHRDLTPSNVLVTADGTARLIDFGIARPADAADAGEDRNGSRPNSLASLTLTPGYAAPERQLSGAVTTAADIYSLGKLLAKLLEDDPDPELRAIAVRAAATDPADRYPTVEALAGDLAAFADQRPVAAVPRTRGYLVRKFVARNRRGVWLAGAAGALLLAAFATTAWQWQRAEQARAAEAERFGQTRAIARSLLFDAYDEVSRTPGSTRAREMLARTGLAYLDALARLPDAPLDVQIETVNGYVRLAQVTGSAGGLMRFEDANVLLGRAQQIAAQLPADAAGVREMRAALLVELAGTSLYNNNDTTLARQQAREAQALIQPVARANPANARTHAAAIRQEGDSHLWDAAYPEARDVLQRGLAFIASVPEDTRSQRDIVMVHASTLRLLGEALHRLQETGPARETLDRGVALNRMLVAGDPEDPALQKALFQALRYRAVVHRTNYRDALARESIDEAVAIARALARRDRDDAEALRMLALGVEVQAQVLSDLRQFPLAYAAVQEGLTAQRQLVERAGNTPGALRSYAQSLRTGGSSYYNGGDYAAACGLWQQAHDVLTGLDRRGELTTLDRNGSLAEMRDYLARACNPPRDGIGHDL